MICAFTGKEKKREIMNVKIWVHDIVLFFQCFFINPLLFIVCLNVERPCLL